MQSNPVSFIEHLIASVDDENIEEIYRRGYNNILEELELDNDLITRRVRDQLEEHIIGKNPKAVLSCREGIVCTEFGVCPVVITEPANLMKEIPAIAKLKARIQIRFTVDHNGEEYSVKFGLCSFKTISARRTFGLYIEPHVQTAIMVFKKSPGESISEWPHQSVIVKTSSLSTHNDGKPICDLFEPNFRDIIKLCIDLLVEKAEELNIASLDYIDISNEYTQ